MSEVNSIKYQTAAAAAGHVSPINRCNYLQNTASGNETELGAVTEAELYTHIHFGLTELNTLTLICIFMFLVKFSLFLNTCMNEIKR